MPTHRTRNLSPEEARAHVRNQAEAEQWDQDQLIAALDDVDKGMISNTPWDVHSSNLAYGVVIGENPDVDRRVAGFPEFGDVVLWHRTKGADCASIGKLLRDSGSATQYPINSRDRTRQITVNRGDKPVILHWNDVVGIKWKWSELQMTEEKFDE